METGGAAVRAADIPRASLTVVLVDSTGYGWLSGQKLGDVAMDFRKCGGVETVASIVSGASIVKAGKKDGTNILDQFMQWVLDGGEETHGGDMGHPCCLVNVDSRRIFFEPVSYPQKKAQRSTSPLARASLMPATHTPGDDSQVSGDSETFVPAYFVLPEQRLARGLGHRASQQHLPHGRRLTALASLSRSRKSGEPLQPKTLKKPMFFFSHRQAEILGCRGARNPVKGYVGYKELCWPYVEPSWRLCWPYVGNMLAI